MIDQMKRLMESYENQGEKRISVTKSNVEVSISGLLLDMDCNPNVEKYNIQKTEVARFFHMYICGRASECVNALLSPR